MHSHSVRGMEGDGYWSSSSASLVALLADQWIEGEAPIVTMH